MNWELENLTPKQEFAIQRGYVAIFFQVFLPCLKAMEPPKTGQRRRRHPIATTEHGYPACAPRIVAKEV
jgi:hypothetical protein